MRALVHRLPLGLAFACALALAPCAAEAAHASWTWSSGGGPMVKGSGHAASETRPATGAQAIRVEGSVDVVVTLGGAETVTVSGDDNLLPLIRTRVEDGVLVVSTEGNLTTKLPLRAEAVLSRLHAVDLRGSGDVTAQASPGELRVSVQGSGDVRVTGIDAPKAVASISGSGDIALAGRCDALAQDIEGSGDFDGTALDCRTAVVSVEGSGNSLVSAAESLDVTIQGSGDVRYSGTPRLTRTIHGSGDVSRR